MFWLWMGCTLTLLLLDRLIRFISRRSYWSAMLAELSADQRQARHLFYRPVNSRHLLGRLYGYVHKSSEGIGLSIKQRHKFTRELLQELLLLSNLFDRIQTFIQHKDKDFMRGWEEGRRYTPSRHSENESH